MHVVGTDESNVVHVCVRVRSAHACAFSVQQLTAYETEAACTRIYV